MTDTQQASDHAKCYDCPHYETCMCFGGFDKCEPEYQVARTKRELMFHLLYGIFFIFIIVPVCYIMTILLTIAAFVCSLFRRKGNGNRGK